MKKILAFILLLIATNVHAQWSNVPALTLSLAGGGTDVTNILTWKLATNSAGGLNWIFPASNGGAGQVLSTDGSGNLNWVNQTDGSLFFALAPATTGRNVGQPANSSSVEMSLQAFGSGSADLLDLLNSSGSTIGFIAHDASAHFPALTVTGQGLGAAVLDLTGTLTSAAPGSAGQVLTSNGALLAPSFQAISAGTVTSVSGSGGTTGLTLTGGPITTSGTLTLGGTLAVANGGTGSPTRTWTLLAPTASTDNVVQGTASGVIPFIVKQHSTATDDLTDWQDNTGTPVASIQPDGTALFSAVFVANNTTVDGDLTVGVGGSHRGQLLLMNATGGNATRLQAASGAAAVTYTLPSADGSSGNLLSTNGSGILSWASSGGSGTVTSVGNTDGSLTASPQPIVGAGNVSINTSHDNAWIINQDFEASSDAVNTYQDGISLYEQYASDATHTQKYSPLLNLTSQVWNTTATAANNFAKFQIANVPTSGASPSAVLEFKAGVGTTSAPALTRLMTLGTNAALTLGAASGSTGIYKMNGATSGTVGITVGAAAGTWTMTLPNTGGSSGQMMTSNGSGTMSWATPFANPFTTTGDILVSTSGTTAGRLAVGTTNQTLQSNGTSPTWVSDITLPNGNGTFANRKIICADESGIAGDDLYLQGSGGNGTNKGGGSLILTAGLGTGSANGGRITIASSLGGASGSAQRSLDRVAAFTPVGTLGHATMTFGIGHNNDVTGVLQFEDTSGNFVQVQIDKPSGGGVTKVYNIPDFGNTGDFVQTPRGVRASLPNIAGSCITIANSDKYVCPTESNATPGIAIVFTNSYLVTRSGKLRNLHVYSTAAPGAAQSTQVNVWIDGNQANLTCTLGATDQQASDLTHSDIIGEYDYVTIEIITSLTSAATTLMYALDVDAY